MHNDQVFYHSKYEDCAWRDNILFLDKGSSAAFVKDNSINEGYQ